MRYDPPNRVIYILQQGILAVLLLLMVAAVVALIALAVLLSAPLFGVMALLVGLLMPAVIMQLRVSPPVTLAAEGLILHPLLGRERRVPWDAVHAVEPYPLLPLPTMEMEVERRIAWGRKHYRPAQGVMLLIEGLPWPYRVTGFFVGRRGWGVIALTNRAHRDYDGLLRGLERYVALPV